jgi:hypothetical protein
MTAAVLQQTSHRHRNISFAVVVFCCIAFFSGAASAAISWKNVATFTTLTNNQMCYTDGTNIVCDSSAPTLLGGNVGIGTTTPATLLQVKGGITGVNLVVNGDGVGADYPASGNFWTLQQTNTANDFEITRNGYANIFSIERSTNNVLINGGNVGIGTTAPDALLHTVASDSNATAYSVLSQNASTDTPYVDGTLNVVNSTTTSHPTFGGFDYVILNPSAASSASASGRQSEVVIPSTATYGTTGFLYASQAKALSQSAANLTGIVGVNTYATNAGTGTRLGHRR